MMPKIATLLAFTTLLLALQLAPAGAQVSLDVYQNPSNLQVLPMDISPRELRQIMSNFSRQVGIRCSTCHEGERGTPLSSYDFSSDACQLKRVARDMLRMVDTTNASLARIDYGEGNPPVEVQCVTCHRGVRRPEMIEDIFARTQAAEGLDAVESKYRELRGIYFPGFAYDFSSRRLGDFANKLLDEGDLDGGIRFHRLALELYPDDGFSYLEFGRGLVGMGRLAEALTALEQALEMGPGFANFLAPEIEELKERIAAEED